MKNTNKQCKLYHNILFLKSILLLYSTKNVLNETKHFAQFHFQCSNKGFVLELSVAKFFFPDMDFRLPRNENKNSGLDLQIKSICQLECCLQRFGVEKCLVIGFSEMAFLHWKQVLRVQFQHRIWLSWFFLRFLCLQKGQRIRLIFSSGFAARATSISTTICQKKNREENFN